MFTRYFRVPEGFENFVYLSQVQQALAIKTAVEYWRRLRPVCMGTLYWQLNDNWPVCSWSSIEYDGSWKLLHYAAQQVLRAGAPVRPGDQGGRWRSGSRTTCRWRPGARATVSVVGFRREDDPQGRSARRARPAGSARLLKSYRRRRPGAVSREGVPVISPSRADGETTFNELFLTEPKRCALADAKVTAAVTEGTEGGFSVRLSADAPAFYVALDAGGDCRRVRRQLLHAPPGAPRARVDLPSRGRRSPWKSSGAALVGAAPAGHLQVGRPRRTSARRARAYGALRCRREAARSARDLLELAQQGPLLDLADPLLGEAVTGAQLTERKRPAAVQTEAGGMISASLRARVPRTGLDVVAERLLRSRSSSCERLLLVFHGVAERRGVVPGPTGASRETGSRATARSRADLPG